MSKHVRKREKKQSFLGGVTILASAVAIVKLIGAVYKLPLNNILGDAGKTYFQSAYEIYNVLLTASTGGMTIAISKLTSEALAQGRENQKRKIFRSAFILLFLVGLAGSSLMFFGAEPLARFLNNEKAYLPIRVLAPAVFCVCLMDCMRGHLQGQSNMKPTAISQVLEATCKLFVGLSLAWYLLHIGMELNQGAAGAILGVTIGTMISLCFLTFYFLSHQNREKALDVPDSTGSIMKNLLSIGIPITFSSSAMSIITLIDSKIVLGRLQNGLLLSELDAVALKGQYSYAMDMLNMVSSFVPPVTMSLIPFAAAALVQKDFDRANQTISNAFRLIALLAVPAGVGLSVLSTPIMRLVLPSQPEGALAAGPHLQVLGIACIFVCLMSLTNVILQTYGKEWIPICTVIIGGIVKVVLNYILVGNPDINIHGAPISTLCCYFCIAGLNLFFVWKYSPKKPQYLRIFFKPVIASILMGGIAWAVYGFLDRALSSGHSVYMANAAATLGGILAGVIVYGILVIALGILRAEDIKDIPHGEKLARILHLKS